MLFGNNGTFKWRGEGSRALISSLFIEGAFLSTESELDLVNHVVLPSVQASGLESPRPSRINLSVPKKVSIVPIQRPNFPLVRPFIYRLNQAMSNRIVPNIVPLIRIRLTRAQLPVPVVSLPQSFVFRPVPAAGHLTAPETDP